MPYPAIIGGDMANTVASGMSDAPAYISLMTSSTDCPLPSRSAQSLRLMKYIACEEPEPEKEKPATAPECSISAIESSFESSLSITFLFCAIDVPGLVFMLTITEPVSSSGISPVLVSPMNTTSRTIDPATVPHNIFLWCMKYSTPRT